MKRYVSGILFLEAVLIAILLKTALDKPEHNFIGMFAAFLFINAFIAVVLIVRAVLVRIFRALRDRFLS